MGLRHLPVVDGDLNVKGMITRADLNEHKLHEYWHHQVIAYLYLYLHSSIADTLYGIIQGSAIMKSINIENRSQSIVHESKGSTRRRGYSVAVDFNRPRSMSTESVYTAELEAVPDQEILRNIRPQSPSLSLPKIIL
jgi:hypothetical protein